MHPKGETVINSVIFLSDIYKVLPYHSNIFRSVLCGTFGRDKEKKKTNQEKKLKRGVGISGWEQRKNDDNHTSNKKYRTLKARKEYGTELS